jgi:Type III restriction enzyme, res subunit
VDRLEQLEPPPNPKFGKPLAEDRFPKFDIRHWQEAVFCRPYKYKNRIRHVGHYSVKMMFQGRRFLLGRRTKLSLRSAGFARTAFVNSCRPGTSVTKSFFSTTIIASGVIQAKLPEGPALFLAHRDELLDQAIDKLKRAAGIVAAREQAGSHADLSDAVVVGSIQTLHVARLERWPAAHFKTIIIDEAHRGMAQTYRKGRIRRTHLASGALRQNSPGKRPFREPSRHALKAK